MEEAAPPAIIARPFDTKDLPKHVGHTVLLTLANGRRYSGVIEQVDARTIRIRIASSSGNSASLSLGRDMIAGVQAMRW